MESFYEISSVRGSFTYCSATTYTARNFLICGVGNILQSKKLLTKDLDILDSSSLKLLQNDTDARIFNRTEVARNIKRSSPVVGTRLDIRRAVFVGGLAGMGIENGKC